eukprot:COSAG01_NODE_621_length_14780_cov_1056.278591_3_plen_256_part_00
MYFFINRYLFVLFFFVPLFLYAVSIPDFDNITISQANKRFYTPAKAQAFATAFSIGYLMANSDMDENLSRFYQKNIRSEKIDRVSRYEKYLGEGEIMIPLFFVLSHYDGFGKEPQFWASQTFKAYVVGAPLLLLSQRLTGASRPGENKHGSKWRFLKDANGVSGHAFMGSVPFLALAKQSNHGLTKNLAYLFSFACAHSRVNDNDHYVSQALLGWFIAFHAVDAVYRSSASQNSSSLDRLAVSSFGDRIQFTYAF